MSALPLASPSKDFVMPALLWWVVGAGCHAHIAKQGGHEAPGVAMWKPKRLIVVRDYRGTTINRLYPNLSMYGNYSQWPYDVL